MKVHSISKEEGHALPMLISAPYNYIRIFYLHLPPSLPPSLLPSLPPLSSPDNDGEAATRP